MDTNDHAGTVKILMPITKNDNAAKNVNYSLKRFLLTKSEIHKNNNAIINKHNDRNGLIYYKYLQSYIMLMAVIKTQCCGWVY